MTLTEERIERYSRQILVPEIGGRGQQRLLSSTVVLRGSGRPAEVCGDYLVGAGVGRIVVDSSSGLVELLGARNPDSVVVSGAVDGVIDVIVSIGAPIGATSPDAAVIAATASGDSLVRLRCPPGTACGSCLDAASVSGAAPPSPAAEVLLGALVAVDVLRALLGLAAAAESTILRVELDSGSISIASFTCPHL